MADKIHMRVISTEGELPDRMVSYLSVPTEEGTVGVLAGHVPMLCAIREGILRCRLGENETLQIKVKDGVFYIADNEALLLASQAEEAAESS